MIRSTNQHQMSRHSSSWGTSFHGGFRCVEAPVAYDEQQVCRAGLPLFDMFLPVRTDPGFGRGLFSQIRCDAVQHSPCRDAYLNPIAAHRHCLSSSLGHEQPRDRQRHREPCSRNQRKSLP